MTMSKNINEIDELVLHQGYRKLRLPFWNEFAYIEPDVLDDGTIGPWTTLHDANMETRVLTATLDAQSGWEAFDD